jgi:TRAP-type C4-dicarboxylate transport system substrate-binding protein
VDIHRVLSIHWCRNTFIAGGPKPKHKEDNNMKSYCKIGVFFLCVILIFSLAACGSDTSGTSSAGETSSASGAGSDNAGQEDFVEMNITYATFLLDTAPSAGIYENLQKKIDERMGGKIQITPYTNGSLLAQNDIFDGVINGVADMGFIQASALADRLKITLLLEQPGLDYNGSQAGSYVMREYLNTLKPKELDDVIWMMPCNTAPNSIVSTAPIHTIADVKGKQIRAVGVAAGAISSLGGVPVSMALPELYESLRNGLLDGAWIVPAAVGNANIDEVAKYQIIVPIGGACQFVVMNKDTFGQMPQAQQDLFMELANEVFEEYVTTYMEDYAGVEAHAMSVKGFKAMEELTYLEGAELQRWRDATSHLAEDYAAALDAEGLDGTGALKLARELCEKYNAIYPPTKENYMMWRD